MCASWNLVGTGREGNVGGDEGKGRGRKGRVRPVRTMYL